MPAVSEEELQKLRDDNEKLRKKIATTSVKQAENESVRNQEIEAMQLQGENARLQAQLAQAEEAAKVSTSKEGAANILEAAQLQLRQAQAVAKQPAGPVDTNVVAESEETDKQNGGNS